MARRIGDIARAAGIGVETLRFYEREGLVDRPAKPARGWRDYDGLPQAQLAHVLLGRRLGLGVAEIRTIKTLSAGEQPPFCATVREVVARRLAALQGELAALQRKCSALEQWLEGCSSHGAESCPLHAEIRKITAQATEKKR